IVCARSESESTSTSKRERRSSTPASAIFSLTRTRNGLFERLERAGHGDAALDVGAELGERQLDRGKRGRDVEDVEPADVADAEDLPLQRALPRRERDAVAVAQCAQEVAGVDALGGVDGGDDCGGVVVGREKLEPHRLDALAARAAETD